MEESSDGSQYMYNGNWTNYNIINEVIEVKGLSNVTIQVKESVYGPVINPIANVAGTASLCLRWNSLDNTDTL